MHINRLQHIQELLKKKRVDAIIVTKLADLCYITDLALSAGSMFITQKQAWLIVDTRYFEIAKKKMKNAIVIANKMLPLRDLLTINENWSIKKIGFSSFDEPVSNYLHYKKELSGLKERSCRLAPMENFLGPVRAIKEVHEIEKIRASCKLCVDGFHHIKKYIREGITENELAQELKLFWIKQGAEKCAFTPIIAFSKNSSMPHYRTQNAILHRGDIILIDIGVVLDGYCSDLTRMLSFGVKSKKLHEIFSVVKQAQAAAVAKCIPGITLRELDAVARDIITQKGYGDFFLHSLGHGLGLEVHEWPIIKAAAAKDEILQEGMCVTVEPGIYLPGEGGVRIEDTILITANGPEILTECPQEMLEIL